MLGELQIFIVGNAIEGQYHAPEFVGIGTDNTKLPVPEDIYCKNIFAPQLYGMVAAVLKEVIYMCGGGQYFYNNGAQGFLSTSRCQMFDMDHYEWIDLNISMRENRTFAQSMILGNNSWLIMGGEDSQGAISLSTEYLDIDAIGFPENIELPLQFSHHCAKIINASHLFTTGGNTIMESIKTPSQRG